MFVVDANILLYAFQRSTAQHRSCFAWLTAALAGPEPVATTDVVELALIRVSSLPKPRGDGIAPADAFRFLTELRAQFAALRIAPGDRHRTIFEELCARLRLRGNDVNDAWLAALALEHDATLVTHDRGFARFPGLVTLDPVAVAGLHESPAAYAAKRRRVSRSARP